MLFPEPALACPSVRRRRGERVHRRDGRALGGDGENPMNETAALAGRTGTTVGGTRGRKGGRARASVAGAAVVEAMPWRRRRRQDDRHVVSAATEAKTVRRASGAGEPRTRA